MDQKQQNKKYLSIKEVSEIVGCSPQSIYQRLNTTLKDYVKVVKGKKNLNISVLKDIYNIDYQENKQEFQQESKGFQQESKDTELLKSIVKTLQEELKEKNKQIEILQRLLDQEQQLHLVEKKNMIEKQQQESHDQEDSEHEEYKKNNVWNKIKQFFVS